MIKGITLWRYRIPLVSPLQLKPTDLTLLTHREGIVLQWHHTRGNTWSEVSPLPGFSKENLDEAECQLNQFLESYIPQLQVAYELQDINPLINNQLYPSVQFGLEMGLMKLTQLNSENVVKTLGIAGLLNDEFFDSKRYSDYSVIKVKVGRKSLKEDINYINNILQHINIHQLLRLDSNQSWTFNQAKQFFAEVPAKQIAFIEEPLKSDSSEIKNYEIWSQEINVPFAFDEQIQNPKFKLKPIQGLSTLVIKPMLTGLSRALELADQAKRLGLNIVISSSYESSLSLNFLYQLSTRITNALPPGLDTFSKLKFDLIEPLTLPCNVQKRPIFLENNLKKISYYEA